MNITRTKHDTQKLQIQITVSEFLELLGVGPISRARKTFITMRLSETFGGLCSSNFKDMVDISVSWEEPA